MSCTIELNDADHGSCLLQKLANSRNDESCDLIINVENRDIRAHRTIVSLFSDYFKAMFRHDTVESKTGIVNMKDVTYGAVKDCVDYMYTGKISIPEESCKMYLHCSILMQIHPISNKISEFLCSKVDLHTFFKYKQLASTYGLESVHEVCDDFAVRNLCVLVETEEFAQLEMEYILMLLKGWKSLYRGLEDQNIGIILKWVKADIDHRCELVTDMVHAIDFTKVSTAYGKYLACNEPLCYQNSECMRLLYLATLENEMAKHDSKMVDDPEYKNSILIFNEEYKCLMACDVNTGTWSARAKLTADVFQAYYIAAVAGNDLYVLCSTQQVYKIKWDNRSVVTSWQKCRSMARDHGDNLRCLYLDGHIYVVGGGWLERYSVEGCQWQICCRAPMDGCAIVESDRWIYAIGGTSEYNCKSNKVVRFNSSMTWESVPSMQFKRSNPGACACDGRIYVAGGFNPKLRCKTAFEQYDTQTGYWTRLRDMTIARAHFALLTVCDKIVACGSGSKSCFGEVYDLETDSWKLLNINFDRKCVAVATVAVKIAWPQQI